MRRDRFFSGDQPYNVLVRGNVLLHREAAAAVRRLLAPLADAASDSIRVLDLACGSIPLTPVEVMESFPDTRFEYTGVDINDEQVAAAGRFEYPSNVVSARVLRGSAWDLRAKELDGPFDLVYVGLNWHHGTPEQIEEVAGQLHARLARGGLLVNHDCYRPDETEYLRPPASDQLPAWKADLIERLERGFLAAGGDPAGAEILAEHSRQRDFPLSTAEVREILESFGLRVEIEPYGDRASPVGRYLSRVVATRQPE